MSIKDKIFKNFGYKLLSVFFACLLWLVVMNTSDYQTTKEIDNIPVTQLNGDVLNELDKLYEVAKGDTVDIVVKGRRSVIGDLSASDFIATADLSEMSITNTVQINVIPVDLSIKNSISITIVDNIMSLNLEEKVSAQFPTKVRVNGEPKAGYTVGSTSASPNIITVEGPQSTVEKITEASVNVDVSGESEDFDTQSTITLYDAYGKQITSDKLTLSDVDVKVSVIIFPVKTVPVRVSLNGTPAEGFVVEETKFSPESVKIAADRTVLSDISEIDVDNISVSGIDEDLQQTVSANAYLPDGAICAEDEDDIVISVKLAETVDKTLDVTKSAIKLTGKQTGYNYKLTLSSFKVTATGFDSVVQELKLADFGMTVDVSKLSERVNYNVPVSIKELEGVNITTSGSVNVEVSAVEDNTEE